LTHLGVILDKALTGGFLESAGVTAPDPTVSPIEFIKSGGQTFSPETKSLITTLKQLPIANKPSVSLDLFDRIRDNISQTFSQIGETTQLLGEQTTALGESGLDISAALQGEVQLREQQRQVDIAAQESVFKEIFGRLDAGEQTGGGFDIFKFFTDNPLFLGLGAGGLIVGGLALFLLLKR